MSASPPPRSPSATWRIRCPFEAGAFDVVTAFNSVQFAADPVAAVKGMSQLLRPGGLISLLVWGPPQQCESGVMFAELGPLLPPRPAEAPGAIAWSEEGQLEHLAALAGLIPVAVKDVPNPLIYPDLATAVRTQLSSGPARAAIRHSGLPAVRGALTRAFAGSRSRTAATGRKTCSATWSRGPERPPGRLFPSGLPALTCRLRSALAWRNEAERRVSGRVRGVSGACQGPRR